MNVSSHTPRWIISRAAALLGLLCGGVAISAGAGTAGAHAVVAPRVVYTPVELRRDLTRMPAAWLGRVVWVRARPVQTFVWTCQHDDLCVVRQPSLSDPAVTDAGDARLPLVVPKESVALNIVRRLPIVGLVLVRLIGARQITWGTVGLYRIQLVAPPACADVTCVVARLIATA